MLQQTLKAVQNWATQNGFQFPTEKTEALHFTRLPGLHPLPQLLLYNSPLPYADNMKFIGLTNDTKLTWKHTYLKIES